MVATRAMRARTADMEEKKDDGGFSDFDGAGDDALPQSTIDNSCNKKEAPDPVTNDSNDHVGAGITSTSNQDTITSTSVNNNNDDNITAPPKTKKKSPLLLLLCASGITSCYLWYGTIQEHIFHMDNANDEEDNESITLFLLATGTFSSFLLAWVWTLIGPIILSQKQTTSSNSNNNHESKQDNRAPAPKVEGKLNHPLIILTSLTYLSAMAASNESLHYVSYPTCVLAKSSKLIPTMVVGWLVDRWRNRRNNSVNSNESSSGSQHVNANNANAHSKSINAMEWIGAALITIGILAFQYIQLHKQQSNANTGHHGDGGKEEKPDSPYGLALLGFSLFMDGLLGACQSTLKRKGDATTTKAKDNTGSSTTTTTSFAYYRPPSAMETMLYINLYATLLLLPASHYVGQFQRGLTAILSHQSSLLLQLNLSAALGQVFIFLTIHHFSPLTCTTITTTRKFFTILLSVYKFGHVLEVSQWVSVGLVFGGLYLEIVAKLFEQHEVVVEGDVGVGKKKKE